LLGSGRRRPSVSSRRGSAGSSSPHSARGTLRRPHSQQLIEIAPAPSRRRRRPEPRRPLARQTTGVYRRSPTHPERAHGNGGSIEATCHLVAPFLFSPDCAKSARTRPGFGSGTPFRGARPRGFEPLTFGSVDRGVRDELGSSKPNLPPKGAKNAPEIETGGRAGERPGGETSAAPSAQRCRLRDGHACFSRQAGVSTDGDAYDCVSSLAGVSRASARTAASTCNRSCRSGPARTLATRRATAR
jgi:hypothetical protein